MNQLGEKPEEVRRQLEEEKRKAREQEEKSAGRVSRAAEPDDASYLDDPAYPDERDQG